MVSDDSEHVFSGVDVIVFTFPHDCKGYSVSLGVVAFDVGKSAAGIADRSSLLGQQGGLLDLHQPEYLSAS